MEGVPRLYMIGLPAKRCAEDRKVDFASALSHHIKQTYDRDPSLYSADIDALLGLRRSAMKAVMSSVCSVDDCTALKRYYAHLVRITDKFPKLMQQQSIGVKESYDDDEVTTTDGPAPPLIFTWKRALGGKINREKQTKDIDTSTLLTDSGDIGYEMRCVLYNLGAAHSRLASAQDRSPPLVTSNMSTAEGEESPSNTALKIACTHLQCSAWAFQQLLGSGETNSESIKWHHRQQPPVTSRSVLEFAYNVTLAQAQECILEKSMMDGRKPLIIAKVSAMICEYFAGAVNAVLKVEREPYCVSMNRIEKWRLYSEFKCRYYGAITALFQGQHVQDQLQQMGTRVSYYRRAVNLLGRAGQISENCGKAMTLVSKDDDSADDDYYYYLDTKDGRKSSGRLAAAKELEMRRDSLAFSMDVAAAKWRAAKSENELIYHEPVVPVLSDEDDSDCLGNNTLTTSSSHRRQLERVKGASLVKPIGFSVDDPELLAVVIADNETSCTTTLFRDLVPTVTRNRAATYRTEKRSLEAYMQSLCQEADDQLTAFSDTLNLECLEMYKNNSNEHNKDDKNVKNELPQQLVNCCASYQALLQQRQEEQGELSNTNEEDQLDIDMARLSSAVQVVDNMLDEIDRLLKTEELGDSEYRRTVGRPYDYSAGRMSELRREASRYREAHVGRARDSWVTLSRAVRDRRRRDLELLALPPDELAARLPPARPTLSAIASEVAAAGVLDSSPAYNSAGESSDQNDDSESDDGSDSRLQQLQQESVMRMDRLNLVVEKMKEVREQRKILLSRLRDDMDREDKDAAAAGQGDADVLGGLRADVDVSGVVKKKLDDRYGSMVKLIERNLSAQQNIMDAVREAYVRAAPERRAYANAMQRRRTIVSSLLDAYESYMVSNGGTATETNSEMVAASPTSGLLPDAVLAERCAKGLDFYQRLLTNVSKLFQRVKGTCQVQTEQRNQIIKQHRQWETSTQQSDNDPASSIGGLDDLLAAVSAVDDQDHHQDDLAALIESFGNNVESSKPPAPLGGGNWNQQHHLRRLSPLGSEQQQKQYYHHYSHPQIQPTSSSTFNPGVSSGGIDYYDYYYDNQQSSTIKANSGHDNGLSTSQQQQRPASHSMHPVVTAEYSVTVGSTAVATPINSTMSLTSPTSSSSMPYSYYNFQLPTASSAVNLALSSPSYNSVTTIAGNSADTTTKSMLNALHLRNNSGNVQNITSPYSQNSGSSNYFPNAAAAIAALQRPLPTQYSVGSINNLNNIPTGVGYNATNNYDYNQASQVQSSRQQQQFYSQHLQQQYQQQMSTTPSVASGGVTGVGSEGVFLQQRQSIASGGGVTPGIQSSLPLPSSSISSATVNHGGLTTSIMPSIAMSSGTTSTNANYFHQPLTQQQQLQLYQQQQQPQLYQQQQQQQPQLYQQQPQLFQQQQQQSQMYKQLQQPQIYQQQQQQQQHPQVYQKPQQPHLVTNLNKNGPGNLHYPQIQQPSQMYQPQQQLQPTAGLTTNTMITNQPQQPSLSNSGGESNNYYQQLQQYQPQTTLASAAPLNTSTMGLNNYYYQQPPMTTPPMTYNHQHAQQPQYYQQQQQQQQVPTASGGLAAPVTSAPAPVVNLLDDDLLLSGPPPIQPEKININGSNENTTSTSTANNIN